MIQLTLLAGLVGLACVLLIALLIGQKRQLRTLQELNQHDPMPAIKESLFELLLQNQQTANTAMQQFSQQNTETQQQHLMRLQNTLRENFTGLEKQLYATIDRAHQQLREQFDKLNQTTQQQLSKMSQEVEQRLSKGFEKTNETFTNIIKRLAIIDDAQKKIADLSENVISLQDILTDKRSRGAFGEMQLMSLIQNMMPPNSYQAQQTLSNGTRVDCLLKLPEPTGHVAVDAKFPLENYKKIMDLDSNDPKRQAARGQFKLDLKKHISDISQKYIIPGETSEGALMFIPAEAIFSEIHANHPDIVETAHRARVFMASPSTMMAILTTAAAVLKDSATRKQVHVIQAHLRFLAQDFTRFEKRMENLSRHISQANTDAEQIQVSAQKISKRFVQIEQVEIPDESTLDGKPSLESTTS